MKTAFNLFLVIWPLLFFGLVRREEPLQLKTSVIIPCHPSHFPLLGPLLRSYQEQTRVPDEIVISLSEAGGLNVGELEMGSWNFDLKILKHQGKQVPGKNRNAACEATTGELIICQDADDFPHPQRVETIAFLFEHFFLDHLLHQWISSWQPFEPIALESLEGALFSFRAFSLIDIEYIHNGSVSFLRPLFSTVRWKPIAMISEDVTFNQHAYAFCKKKAVLKIPLIQYRGEYSTFDLNGDK